jgi:hypothetical protein
MLLLATPCSAQEVATGFEGGPSIGEAFFAPTFSWNLDAANAITFKPGASYLYYDTRGKTGQETKITAPEASFGVGYRFTGTDVTLDIGPAFEVLWQTKKPTGGKLLSTEETLTGVAAAADLYWQATSLTGINLVATYDAPNRYYWTRGTLKERVTDLDSKSSTSISLGADATYQGSTDVHQLGGGGLVEFDFQGGSTALQLRGGYSWLTFADHSHDQRPYAGATLYHHF